VVEVIFDKAGHRGVFDAGSRLASSTEEGYENGNESHEEGFPERATALATGSVMSITLSRQDFRAFGLQIDPDDPTRAITVEAQSELIPDASWDLDQLGIYAETGLLEANRLKKESLRIGRRSTVQIFRAGHALSIARRKVKAEKWGEWGRWLATHNLKRTTAWEAIQLYERAGSEDAIANLTPGEAKRQYDIYRRTRRVSQQEMEPQRQKGARRSVTPASDLNTSPGDESANEEWEESGLNDDDCDADETNPERDDLVKPPRTLRAMLTAAINLLLASEQKSHDMDVAYIATLDEIIASAYRLKAKVTT
jgi:hypothetical protein